LKIFYEVAYFYEVNYYQYTIMLKTIRNYTPSTLTNWWYGTSGDNESRLLVSAPVDEFETEAVENSHKNATQKETQFTKNSEIIGIERNGLSSEDDYKTAGSEFNHSGSITHQFPSSDDEFRMCSEQQYKLDNRVSCIVLEGLSETNDEDDELSSLNSISRNSCNDSSLLSQSAPAGEIRKMFLRNIEHIYEHTDDSDSSYHFDNKSNANDTAGSSWNNKTKFPFALFTSSRKHRRRRAASSSCKHERSLILKVRPKSYGAASNTEDDERTVSFSGKRSQARSIESLRRGSGYTLSDSNYPAVSLDTNHLSVSFLSNVSMSITEKLQIKRQSIFSESSLCSLNTSWSEYTVSLSSLEEALECRESDPGSTGEAVCSTTTAKKTTPQYLVGHKVKESFIDDECYCCYCTIL